MDISEFKQIINTIGQRKGENIIVITNGIFSFPEIICKEKEFVKIFIKNNMIAFLFSSNKIDGCFKTQKMQKGKRRNLPIPVVIRNIAKKGEYKYEKQTSNYEEYFIISLEAPKEGLAKGRGGEGMSFLNIWRYIFGTPIRFKVQQIKKGRTYIWKIDTDDPQVIKAFQKKVKQALKEGHVIVPYDMEIEEVPKEGQADKELSAAKEKLNG